jgi:hypothetical protein
MGSLVGFRVSADIYGVEKDDQSRDERATISARD